MWWAVHPGTKEAIRYFRRLFQEGLVDPEFPIMTRPQWLDKQRQDTYGTMWWWNTHLDEGYSQWWTEFKRGVPHAQVSFIPPAPDPQGRRRMPGQGVKGYSPGLIIFSHAEHPEKAIQLVDYLATDEGAALAAFGLPGVHWEEGDNRVISKIDTAEDQAAAGNYIFSWFFRRDNMMVTSPLVFENRAAYVDYVQRPIIEDRVEAEGEYRAGLGGTGVEPPAADADRARHRPRRRVGGLTSRSGTPAAARRSRIRRTPCGRRCADAPPLQRDRSAPYPARSRRGGDSAHHDTAG